MTLQGQTTRDGLQRAWKILGSALVEFSRHRIPSVAGAITFFFLLALFPALACVASIYGTFANRSTIVEELHEVSSFLPEGAATVLVADLERLAALPASKLNLGFFTALLLAIWSASGGVKALIEGLNVAYGVEETRGFFRLTFHALALTVIVVIAVTIAIQAAVILPEALERLPFDMWLNMLFRIFAWPLIFVVCTVLATLIYRYGPDRTSLKRRWLTWGGAVASAVWVLGTLLFTWYVRHFGTYNEIYGNLGAIVGFLTWIWLSLVMLLFGAEINSAIGRARMGK